MGAPASTVRPDVRAAITLLLSRSPVVAAATARLAVLCLATRGVTSSEGERTAVEQALRRSEESTAPTTLAGIVSPLSAAEAAERGYRGVVAPHGSTQQDAGLSDRVQAALSPPGAAYTYVEVPDVIRVGAPATGCLAEARTQLFGSVESWLLVDQFVAAGIRRFAVTAMRSPAVVEAAGRYERCMAERGYATKNPADTARQARLRWVEPDPAGAPTAEELAMAGADADCQRLSGVHAVLDDAVLELAGTWIRDNESTILELADTCATAIERARQVLAG